MQYAILLATHVMLVAALVVTAVPTYKPPTVAVPPAQSVTLAIAVVIACLASIGITDS